MRLFVRRLAWILAVLSPVLTACAPIDQCVLGEARCQGIVAQTCMEQRDKFYGTHAEWDETDLCDLPRQCVIGSHGDSFCATSSAQPAACEGADGAHCEGDTVLTCREGWGIRSEDCAASNAHCESAPAPACVTNPDPNRICGGVMGTRSVCECAGEVRQVALNCGPATLIRCEQGILAAQAPCPFCRIVGGSATGDSAVGAGVCGISLGDVCPADADCTPGLFCGSGMCTVACTPSDVGTDPCQALLADPASAVWLDPTRPPIRLGSCAPVGVCAWSR